MYLPLEIGICVQDIFITISAMGNLRLQPLLQQFTVYALYLYKKNTPEESISSLKCEMYNFFKKAYGENSTRPIKHWWSEDRRPRGVGSERLVAFFKYLFKSHGKTFNPPWYSECQNKNVSWKFEDINTLCYRHNVPISEVIGFAEPYTYGETYLSYVNMLPDTSYDINKYHGFYHLYRIHSVHNNVVREVIHIDGNIRGTCKFTIYQHFGGINSAKVIPISGNVFFDERALFFLASLIDDRSQNAHFNAFLLVVQRDDHHSLLAGMGNGLTDNEHLPTAFRFVIKKPNEENIKPTSLLNNDDPESKLYRAAVENISNNGNWPAGFTLQTGNQSVTVLLENE
jgi:hypothetical protein